MIKRYKIRTSIYFIIHACLHLFILHKIYQWTLSDSSVGEDTIIKFFFALLALLLSSAMYLLGVCISTCIVDAIPSISSSYDREYHYRTVHEYIDKTHLWCRPLFCFILLIEYPLLEIISENMQTFFKKIKRRRKAQKKKIISIKDLFFRKEASKYAYDDPIKISRRYAWCSTHNKYIFNDTYQRTGSIWCKHCYSCHYIDNNVNEINVKDYEYINQYKKDGEIDES